MAKIPPTASTLFMGVFVIGILTWIYTGTSDTQQKDKIFAGLLATIGAVSGFYFGQRPVMDVTDKLVDANEENAKNKVILETGTQETKSNDQVIAVLKTIN